MTENEEHKPILRRIVSLDQFRGFAILGMILVNYLGRFDSIPDTMKHPNYGMTFANAIAPFFLFAVGMGFKMSFERQVRKSSLSKGLWTAIKRYFTLILIGIVIYGPDLKLGIWDALVDIGFAGLITLPFILTGRWVRITIALVYLIGYQCIFSFSAYGEWTMAHSIDGGPLGVLSWASILIFGTLLMDDLAALDSRSFIRRSLITGALLMMLGCALSNFEPPTLWQFSQRSMTIAYPLFAAGLCYAVFIFFYWLSDLRRFEVPHLTALGINPLVLYIAQNVIIEYHSHILERSAPLWQALSGGFIIYLICYAIARYMARNNLIVKI